jgi:cytoskeleton protein RodZ
MSEATPQIGPRLKAARIAKGMSVAKAADDLHLDAWVVDALEADEWARLGPEVFVKGHLRRYASLLGLPVEDIMAAVAARASSRNPTAPTPARDPRPAVSRPWPSAAAVAALVLIGVGTLWIKPRHAAGPGGTSPAPAVIRGEASSGGALLSPPQLAAAQGAAGVPAAVRPPSVSNVLSVRPAAGRTPSAIAVAAVAPAADSLDAVLGTGHARLRLSFSADSWVEVHDATGRRVFAGNGRANSVKTLSGAAPMHVYLRYASGVQLEINDRAVAIGRQFMAGDVARFEAGADRVLRRELRPSPAPAVAQSRDERPAG